MEKTMTQPLATIRLELNAPPDGSVDARDIRESLSAVAQGGRHLWLGCDETATLERLTDLGGGHWGEHRTFSLADVLDLPEDDDDEVDVEGLAWDPPYLWVVGSHSRKRGKPDADDDVEAVARALAGVDKDENRYILARIPLEEDAESGGMVPRRSCPDPRDPGKTLTAARLTGKGRHNKLIRLLRKDPHLRKFIKLPGKDNGLDIEGISAVGGRLFLGLRGPVLRGWAMVLEVQPVQAGKPERLKLKRIGPDGRRFRKHYLDLDGLGVREITHTGDEMLVLAGPTMDVRAAAAVFRWRGALATETDSVGRAPALKRVMELPHDVDGPGDHPEGMCRFRAEGMSEDGLLVVYDSPARRRQRGGSLRADVFPMPGATGGLLARVIGAVGVASGFGGGGGGGGEDADGGEADEGEARGLSRSHDPPPEPVEDEAPPPREPDWPRQVDEGWPAPDGHRGDDQQKWEEGEG
jgi:hypothetical protein